MKNLEIFETVIKKPAIAKRMAGIYKNRRFAAILFIALDPEKYMEVAEITFFYRGRTTTYGILAKEMESLSYYFEHKIEKILQIFLEYVKENKELNFDDLIEYLDEDIE